MKKNRIAALALSLAMTLALAACGGSRLRRTDPAGRHPEAVQHHRGGRPRGLGRQ